MGHNSLLYQSLGIFASRDNIWTSNPNINQTGCGNYQFCYEANAHLDNAVALLSNGPYGIGDALEFVNKTVVMYSCRSDGLLLRPRHPIASLDFSFTDKNAKGSSIWAAHDDFGSLRWSYIVGVRLAKNIAITPNRLLQGMPCSCSCEKMVAWEVMIGRPVTNVIIFSCETPFMLPKSKPLNLPYDVISPPHTHFNTAPVLPNGMVFLGETDKWATMSFGRILSMEIDADIMTIIVVGAPSEIVSFSYMKNAENVDDIDETKCYFESSCSSSDDQHENSYCKMTLTCSPQAECTCVDKSLNDKLLRGKNDKPWNVK
jgi:hypothetical protein